MGKCCRTVVVDGFQLPFVPSYLGIVDSADLGDVKVELLRVFYLIVVVGLIGSPFFLTFKHMLLMQMSAFQPLAKNNIM